jgi:hypothetical protein
MFTGSIAYRQRYTEQLKVAVGKIHLHWTPSACYTSSSVGDCRYAGLCNRDSVRVQKLASRLGVDQSLVLSAMKNGSGVIQNPSVSKNLRVSASETMSLVGEKSPDGCWTTAFGSQAAMRS